MDNSTHIYLINLWWHKIACCIFRIIFQYTVLALLLSITMNEFVRVLLIILVERWPTLKWILTRLNQLRQYCSGAQSRRASKTAENFFSLPNFFWSVWTYIYCICQGGYAFVSVCLSVCLTVCLYVTKITQRVIWVDFLEVFWKMYALRQKPVD